MRRYRRRIFPALLIGLLMANGLFAQSREFPYELKKHDSWLLPMGLGLSALGSVLYHRQAPITAEEILLLDRKDVNAFDRCATFNWSPAWGDRSDVTRDLLVYSTVLLATVPSALRAQWSDTLTLATMMAETALFVGGVTALTKAAVGRKRPYLYNPDLSIDDRIAVGDGARSSFFSGHTSASFAAAAFVSKVFTDLHGPSLGTKLLWVSSISVAALTAYARVEAGMHYPSDVIVGAAVGFGIGYLVPTLHRKEWRDRISATVAPNRISLSLRF